MIYQHFIDQLNELFPDCFFRPELRFCEGQKWSFDIYLKCCKFAIEIEGGVRTNFGHRSITNFLKDMRKYNQAAILGWRIIRIEPSEIYNDSAINQITEYLRHNPCSHSQLNKTLREIHS